MMAVSLAPYNEATRITILRLSYSTFLTDHMYRSTLIAWLLCYLPAQAQWPTIAWQAQYFGTSGEFGLGLVADGMGGYFITGGTGSDLFVARLDGMGDTLWATVRGGSASDQGAALVATSDGGAIAVGLAGSNDGDVIGHHGGSDGWVVKVDAAGQYQWQRTMGGSGMDDLSDVVSCPDGGYLVTGTTNSDDGDVSGGHGQEDMWLVKLDAAGDLLWQRTYGGTSVDKALAVAACSDGSFVIAGHTSSTDGDAVGNIYGGAYWVVKVDDVGDLIWQHAYGGAGYDYGTCITATFDGGYLVGGSSTSLAGQVSNNHGSADAWVVKLDSVGSLQWQRSLGGSEYDRANSVIQVSDSSYVVGSIVNSSDGDVTGLHGETDIWLAHLDLLGTLQWQKTLGGTATEMIHDLIVEPDGAIVLVGQSTSDDGDLPSNLGGSDIWVVKLDPLSTGLSPSAIKQGMTVFPVPAEEVIWITGVNMDGGAYNLMITDPQGRTVLRRPFSTSAIDVRNLLPGTYIAMVYDASGLPVAIAQWLKGH
jgi:hypothetical protein